MDRKILEERSRIPIARLEQCLFFKENEVLGINLLEKATGIGIVFFANRNQLLGYLSKKERALVLSLDELTNSFLEDVEKYFQEISKQKSKEDDALLYQLPNVRPIMEKIDEMSTAINSNEAITNQVAFLVTFGERSKPFSCSYSVYKSYSLLKEKIRRLPDPSTGWKISAGEPGIDHFQIMSSCQKVAPSYVTTKRLTPEW